MDSPLHKYLFYHNDVSSIATKMNFLFEKYPTQPKVRLINEIHHHCATVEALFSIKKIFWFTMFYASFVQNATFLSHLWLIIEKASHAENSIKDSLALWQLNYLNYCLPACHGMERLYSLHIYACIQHNHILVHSTHTCIEKKQIFKTWISIHKQSHSAFAMTGYK